MTVYKIVHNNGNTEDLKTSDAVRDFWTEDMLSAESKTCRYEVIENHGLPTLLVEFMRTVNSAIAGSYVTAYVQDKLAGGRTFEPADIDVFMLPLDDEVNRLPGETVRESKLDYAEIELTSEKLNSYIGTKYVYTNKIGELTVQFICYESFDPAYFNFERCVSAGMDFTVASFTMSVTPAGQVVLGVRHRALEHLKEKRLAVVQDTRESRVEKWNERGFVENEGRVIKRLKNETHQKSDEIRLSNCVHTGECGRKIYLEDIGIHYFYNCDDLHLVCVDRNVKLHIESSRVFVSGIGGEIYAYASSVICEQPDSKFFMNVSDYCEPWLRKRGWENPYVGFKKIVPLCICANDVMQILLTSELGTPDVPIENVLMRLKVEEALNAYTNAPLLPVDAEYDGKLYGETDAYCWKHPNYKAHVPFTRLQRLVWGLDYLRANNGLQFAVANLIRSHREYVPEITDPNAEHNEFMHYRRYQRFLYDMSVSGSVYAPEYKDALDNGVPCKTIEFAVNVIACCWNVPANVIDQIEKLNNARPKHQKCQI
jgi:hypothetical protein